MTHDEAVERLVPALEKLAELFVLASHASIELKVIVDSLDPRAKEQFLSLARKHFTPLVERLRAAVT